MAEGQEKDVSETTTTIQADLIDQESVKSGSTVSTKIRSLRNNKKLAKSRMTKAKKQLSDLIENRPQDVALPSKNAVRRAVHKINSEMNIITKIIDSLKGVYAMTENNEETNTVIYTLDKELEDIGYSVDVIIEGAENHLEERINAEETESVLLSLKSHVSVDKYSVPSNVPPNVPSNVPPKVSSNVPPMYPPMYPPTYPPMYPPKYPPTYPPMYPTMYPPTYIPMYATMYPPIYLQQYLHT
jgi:hypothetical protein